MVKNNEAYIAGPSVEKSVSLTLGELLKFSATESPDYRALVAPSVQGGARKEASYGQLFEQSERCARRLLKIFKPGDRIALWSGNSYEWVVLQFGAALAGLILVPVNPAFKAEEAKYVLKQSKSVACFAAKEFRGTELAKLVEKMQPEIETLEQVIDISSWEAFFAGDSYSGDLPVVKPEDPAMIQYTSGTTGFPKGALLIHERLVWDATQVAERARVRKNSVWMVPLPLFHAGGCVVGVLGAVSKMATIVLMDKWSAETALDFIENDKVEVMNPVPAMLVDILGYPNLEDRDISSWVCAISGASTVPAALVRKLQNELGLEVFIIFGQTECGPVATMTNPSDTPEDKENTVGTPLAGFEMKIVDPDTGETLQRDEVGEFVARGNTMIEYFDNPDATESTFDQEGWLHTGDLCSIDERGYVRVEGRIRDMIIRGGENIYPREIEEYMENLPSIKEVALVGLPHERMGEIVGAFVVVDPNSTFNKDEVVELMRSHFAFQKVPEIWVLLDALPRTATGKVQKYLLRNNWVEKQYQPV